MIGELGAVLMTFRGCFPRGATFRWFVVAVFGFVVRLDHHGVSSSIRWLGIRPQLYEPFLAFFRSRALRLGAILEHWQGLVMEQCALRTRAGAFILVGDGIKIGKEAERMPGVKKLHQESENSGKAPWIFGHHFGVIGLLVGVAEKLFCVGLAAELHEGVEALRKLQGKPAPVVKAVEKTSIVSLMGNLLTAAASRSQVPCVAILDAFFAVGTTFLMAATLCRETTGERLLHIITRAKDNVVAYEVPVYKGSGRRPKYGKKLVLAKLFSECAELFQTVTLNLYGETKTISILCLDLLWKPIQGKLRFVLVKDGTATFILLCSDLTMDPTEILQLYSVRFKIEVTFKVLKHIIGGLCYHFWTSCWKDLNGPSLSLEDIKDMPERSKELIAVTMNAIEAFLNIALIATGILQLLALRCSEKVWQRHRWWMRTYSSDVPSEEVVKRVIQNEFYHHFRDFKHTAIYKIIRDKVLPHRENTLRMAA